MTEQLPPDANLAAAASEPRWSVDRILLAVAAAGIVGLAVGVAAIAVQLSAVTDKLGNLPDDYALQGVTEELGKTRKAIEDLKPAPVVTAYDRSLAEGLLTRPSEDPVAAAIREQTQEARDRERRDRIRDLMQR